MTREFAKELKHAGFPIPAYRPGHHFFPHENSTGWSDFARDHGVTIGHFELENRLQDIKDGYYCPALSDLLDACGQRFARLSIVKDIWFAQCDAAGNDRDGAKPRGSRRPALARAEWKTDPKVNARPRRAISRVADHSRGSHGHRRAACRIFMMISSSAFSSTI